MSNPVIHNLKLGLKTTSRCTGEKLLRSLLLKPDNLSWVIHQASQAYIPVANISIDSLRLNLGTIPAAQFDTQFNSRLAQVLKEALVPLLKEAPQQTGRLPDRETEAVPSRLLDALSASPDSLLPLALCCLQPSLLHQLLQSRQPSRLKQLLQTLLNQNPLSAEPAFSYRQVTASRLAIAALGHLLSQPQGIRWLGEHSASLSQLASWSEAISSGEINTDQIVQLFTGLARSASVPARPELPDNVIRRWLLPLWQRRAVRRQILQRVDRETVAEIDGQLRYSGPDGHNGFAGPGGRNGFAGRRQSGTVRADILAQPVFSAGVVLLWPLLPQLFTLLALTEKEQFISDAARWQAALSLDYLAWAAESPDSDRLALRLLCAISPDAPLPPDTLLSTEQQQQIDRWLLAVGRQLPAWQKFSLTDIRQLFLQRPGEIIMQTEPPQIVVRSESFDLLLGDWPWPLTLVQFPWLKHPFTLIWPVGGL